MVKQVNKLELIEIPSSAKWSAYDIYTNEKELTDLGIFQEVYKKVGHQLVGTGEYQILHKTVLVNNDDNCKYVVKTNLYKPSNESLKAEIGEYYDITTGAGEYIWSWYSKKLNISSILETNMCHLILNNKKKFCSYNKIEDGYRALNKIQQVDSELYENLKSENKLEQPLNARIFLSIIGKIVKTGDILFNSSGDVKFIDLGDSNTSFINKTFGKLFAFIEQKEKEEQIDILNQTLDMLSKMISLKSECIEHFYSIYNKPNLTYSIQAKAPTGLALYEGCWFQLSEAVKNKLIELTEAQ